MIDVEEDINATTRRRHADRIVSSMALYSQASLHSRMSSSRKAYTLGSAIQMTTLIFRGELEELALDKICRLVLQSPSPISSTS